MTRQVRYKGRRMHIAGELTIYTAATVHAEISSALAKGNRIQEVDLSAVTEIDTAGLQLLLMARRSVNAAQRPLQVLNPSSAVSDLLGLLQLGETLQGTVEGAPAP